jgi:hypothetical protein
MSKIAAEQYWNRAKEVLMVLHGGPSEGHLGVKKTLNKVRQRYYWSRQDAVLRDGADSATSMQQIVAPGTGIWATCTNTMLRPRSKG